MKPDYLLDVNVLLALAWPNHQFHRAAHNWFTAESAVWATCAVTELGFVRLSSNPAYTPAAVSPPEAAALLAQICAHPRHTALASPSLATVTDFALALGHKQVTDVYLVALARFLECRLATFDRRLQALAPDGLLVLSPE